MQDLPPKDPDSIVDYGIDWSRYLPTGVTISSSSWSVPSGITEDASSKTDTTTSILLSGGTADTDYVLVNSVVLSNGHEDDQSITIFVRTK